MRIKFLGAAGEVTGSCYVVKAGGEELMVDCGMFQGEGADEKNRNGLETDVSRLGAVVLTHAHLDHCGRLPLLVKQGFKGSIFTTPASRDLVEIVLLDAAKVAASNEDVEPIYSQAEVEQVLGMIKTVNYGEKVRVGGFDFELLDADIFWVRRWLICELRMERTESGLYFLVIWEMSQVRLWER